MGDFKLEDQFPRLALLDENPDYVVAKRWSEEGWDWRWNREINRGPTHDQLGAMKGLLEGFRCGYGSGSK